MDDFAIFFTLVVLFFAWYFTRKLVSRGNERLPPSPPSLPIIGNLHQLGQLPHRSLWDLSRKYGPLILLKFGLKPTLIVSTAQVAKEVLKNHDLSFADRPVLISFKKILYESGLISSPYGTQWRKLRSIFVHELLSSTRVKSYNSIMEEETGSMIEKIKQSCLSSSPIDLSDTFKSLTNDLVCRAAFGNKLTETRQGKQFLKGMKRGGGLLFNFTLGEFVPCLGWINWLSGFNTAMDMFAKKTDEMLDKIIEHHLNKATNLGESCEDNFVDILLGIHKGNTPGVSMDLINVKAAILDVLGAGTETSATTLEWVMTELIRHPEIMKKLQGEIREILNGREHITTDDLHKMRYLKAVIKETFRIHPPVAVYPRATREYVNVIGYEIEADTFVLINVWAIGRDPTYWHEPEVFMPDRFLNSSVDFRGLDYQLIPFGAGRRICPGVEFAAKSIEHIIANFVHKFDWALPDGAKGEDLDVTEKPGLTIPRKNPLVALPTYKP